MHDSTSEWTQYNSTQRQCHFSSGSKAGCFIDNLHSTASATWKEDVNAGISFVDNQNPSTTIGSDEGLTEDIHTALIRCSSNDGLIMINVSSINQQFRCPILGRSFTGGPIEQSDTGILRL